MLHQISINEYKNNLKRMEKPKKIIAPTNTLGNQYTAYKNNPPRPSALLLINVLIGFTIWHYSSLNVFNI